MVGRHHGDEHGRMERSEPASAPKRQPSKPIIVRFPHNCQALSRGQRCHSPRCDRHRLNAASEVSRRKSTAVTSAARCRSVPTDDNEFGRVPSNRRGRSACRSSRDIRSVHRIGKRAASQAEYDTRGILASRPRERDRGGEHQVLGDFAIGPRRRRGETFQLRDCECVSRRVRIGWT